MKFIGPEFRLHYRYARVLNVCFVTLIFGTGLPVLYIFGIVSFVVMYWTDRFLLTYSYQKPFISGDVLSKLAMEIFPYSGILHLFFAYWMISNIQITSNYFGDEKIQDATHVEKTGHVIANITFDENIQLLLIGVIALVFYFFR